MKRIYGFLLLNFIVVFCLSGCAGKKNKEQTENSTEAYYYDSDLQIKTLEPGFMNHEVILGSNGILEFGSYYKADSADYEYKMLVTDMEGKQISKIWTGLDGEIVKGIGYVIGSDNFVAVEGNCRTENAVEKWSLCTYDNAGTKKNSVDVTSAFGNSSFSEMCRIAVDENGYIHAIVSDYTGKPDEYRVISADGKLIYSYMPDEGGLAELISTQKGEITFLETFSQNSSYGNNKVCLFDINSNKLLTLFEYGEDSEIDSIEPISDNKVLFATNKGLFLSDFEFKEKELLSSFENQAFMVAPKVIGIADDGQDGFFVLSERMNQGAQMYLQHYSKAPENIKTIELALDLTMGSDIYSEAVVEFNKKHPDRKIVVKADYDKTLLRTKLIAGEGPVLVDSSMVSFGTNKDLWEPVDYVYAECNQFINDSVKEMITMDGATYAVTADYFIRTMVSAKAEEDINYEGFVKLISDSRECHFIMDNNLTDDVSLWLATSLLDAGPTDSFYIDKKTGSTRFDSPEFDKMLNLLDRLSPKDRTIDYFEGLRSGEILFNFVSINSPLDLFFWNEKSKSGIRAVGMPKNSGAKNEICIPHALMLRKSASAEEKEIASEFLKMLLSKEAQLKMASSPNFHLSIRDDVLKEQLGKVKDGDMISMSFFSTPEDFIIEEPNSDEVERFLYSLVSKAFSRNGIDAEYENILDAEFSDYFNNGISAEMLKSHLSNRIGLYLKENQ